MINEGSLKGREDCINWGVTRAGSQGNNRRQKRRNTDTWEAGADGQGGEFSEKSLSLEKDGGKNSRKEVTHGRNTAEWAERISQEESHRWVLQRKREELKGGKIAAVGKQNWMVRTGGWRLKTTMLYGGGCHREPGTEQQGDGCRVECRRESQHGA